MSSRRNYEICKYRYIKIYDHNTKSKSATESQYNCTLYSIWGCFKMLNYVGITLTNRNAIMKRTNSGTTCYYSIWKLFSSRLLFKTPKIRVHKPKCCHLFCVGVKRGKTKYRVEGEDVLWIQLAQDGVSWWTLVNKILNLRVPKGRRISRPAERVSASQ